MADWSLPDLQTLIARIWGFPSLRPMQQRAMAAVLDRRDSLVVLPTGGGKSLCYQAPAVFRDETTVVVSPLISLMRDQVDSLRTHGVSAVSLDSSQSPAERFAAELAIAEGNARLVFVSPERLTMDSFRSSLRKLDVRTFAIDEAHCISHWGHDFRPEYRQLAELRTRFPGAAMHAYTATATEQVRTDIIRQLGLRDPEVLVGNFDRPNLTYRVVPRRNTLEQVGEILARHQGEAGIIYCIRRRDVDELCQQLKSAGHSARPYHAGLSPDDRAVAQDEFINERCDLIVATVAFGMGIDRSNVRFVIHTGMPKSIEHYQQEAGRAGRDGLPAECVLLYSLRDVMTWKWILEKSAEEADLGPEFLRSSMAHVNEIRGYCQGVACRHKALVEHFGQAFEGTCSTCDVCMNEVRAEPDSTVIAQKILSCVARVKEGYGIAHVLAVLHGERDERIERLGHDRLSTFGLLHDTTKKQIRDWIRQLIGQRILVQDGGEYPILKLTPEAWQVMRSQRQVRLSRIVRERTFAREKAKASTSPAEAAADPLFEVLRRLRRDIARELGVPPYVVFHDTTLREMARQKPAELEAMLAISGVGQSKMKAFGDRFLEAIRGQLGTA